MVWRDADGKDSFESAYASLKAADKALSLTEESLKQQDRIITQFLSRNFNGSSAIQTDRFERPNMFSSPQMIDVEASKIKQNEKKLTDFNSDETLTHKSDKLYVINKLIAASPSLQGMNIDIAKKIESGKIADKDLKAQFPNADLNIVKAAAYTLLNATQESLPNGKPDQNLQDMALTHLHYAQEGNKAYDTWAAGKQAEITARITSSHSLMSDLKQLRCPQNISTTAELEEQFKLRQNIAREMTDIYASVYGVQNTLKGADDINIIYKSREQMLENSAFAYVTSNLPGVVNDETIIYKYNPAAELSRKKYPGNISTDQSETKSFLNAMSEELQHAVDNANADKAVLGQQAHNPGLEQHNISYIINTLMNENEKLKYPTGYSQEEHASYKKAYDRYAAQYVESTAKISAENVTAGVMKSYDAPLPPQNAATPPAEKSLLDRITNNLNAFNPFK